MKFERDYDTSLEYTFFNLFPQNVGAIQVGYDASKILTASATFEYTRYVCGPISNISKYRSGAGYNNLTVAELKEMVDSGVDVTKNKKEVISKGDEFIKSGDSVNNSKTINKKFQIGDGAGFI